MKMQTCRHCSIQIQWGLTDKGRRMPVDMHPVDDGNVRWTSGTTVQVLTKTELDEAKAAGELLYKAHFATCPKLPQRGRR